MQRLTSETRPLTRSRLRRLAERLGAARSLGEVGLILRRFASRVRGTSWAGRALTLSSFLLGISDEVPHAVFVKKNAKLPFWNFSTLPGVTCPGAGECLDWCYSFRSWRHAAPFFRQAQNTLLLRYAPQFVREAVAALPEGAVVRLFVDGDLDSYQSVAVIMGALRARPDLRAYGYSKSWDLLAQYHALEGVPPNYVLNLSAGGAGQKVSLGEMMRLPFVRGEFVGVEPDGRHARGFARYESADYHRDVRRVALALYPDDKVLSCPGQCGTCCKAKDGGPPACGDPALKGLVIANGLH
jgi:hypothetical protein